MEFVSPSRRAAQSGQIGIIVVLIMVVLLTIGLSLASRTTKEVALSTQEQESTRVFDAAEVGVEQALSTSLSFAGNTFTSSPLQPTGSNATVTYTINKQFDLEMQIFQGYSAMIQLTDATHPNPPPSLLIDWSTEDCTNSAASLMVSIFTVDTSVNPATVKVRYKTFEPCGRGNGFSAGGISGGQNGYFKRATIGLAPKDNFVRIKPIYNDTKMLVQASSGQLPVQSYAIHSSGNNNNGTENRNVQVTRSLPTAPSIFDFNLFSGTTIVK